MSESIDPKLLDLLRFECAVEHRNGAVRLDGFPLLVHVPDVSAGVLTEDNHTPVAAIAARAAETPDYARLAAAFNTTADHVRQAIAYVIMNPGG